MGIANALGLKVAPAEQRRKAAWISLLFTIVIGGGAIAAFVGPTAYRHYTFSTAQARVVGLGSVCHYQIKRFNKRGPAQVTGMVDCRTAELEAARNDHPMGEVVKLTEVGVVFDTVAGTPVKTTFTLPAAAAADLVIGQTLAIQYDPEMPGRVERRADKPFALKAEKRYDKTAELARQAGSEGQPPRKKFELAKDGEPMSGLEIFSRTVAWIIVALMGLALLWLVRVIWRFVRRLLGGGGGKPSSASASTAPRRVVRAVPAARAVRVASSGQGRAAGQFSSQSRLDTSRN